jgi:GDP-L-fucose synthase
MDKRARIYVAGHRGMVGSAIGAPAAAGGYANVLTAQPRRARPAEPGGDVAFLQAGKARLHLHGGGQGGRHPRQQHLSGRVHLREPDDRGEPDPWRHEAGVERCCFLGSSCIYPRDCPQPIREEYLLTGPLEPTNEPYAIAKIAGIKLCESYNRSTATVFLGDADQPLRPQRQLRPGQQPCLPALIRKAHEAKQRGDTELVVWGSGTPRREFLYVDDLADACVFLMERGYVGAADQHRHRRGRHHPRARRDGHGGRGFPGRIVFDATSRTARRASWHRTGLSGFHGTAW